ncbi:MAG: hypothetical protein GY785_20570 [Gammaproteobacteria bacterium]|nr:hypothetical protein [Gammaproteobacteria bacterium]
MSTPRVWSAAIPAIPVHCLDERGSISNKATHHMHCKDIEAAERFSDQIEVAYVLGLYFVAEDQHQQAIHAFGQYLTRFPVFTPAIYGRAKAHAKLGLIELSIRDYQYLLSASKEHSPDYYLELARLESTLEPYGLHLALRSLDRGIESLGLLVSLLMAALSSNCSA